ncbi:MAG: YtxH domain-containing protein [Patescibacteria group bacterium]
MADKKTSSHLGAGLLAGAMLGIAAGIFMQSPKGKKVTKDIDAKMKKMQKQLTKQLKNAKSMSKEQYGELVDDMMKYYASSKEIAKDQIPEIRAYLLKKWKEIEKQMKSEK